ncbi:MAG: hypothetical protein JSC189_000469 [Candidatus Tokpelaia sp. JSC189]|nr:MAG: hypothetical protein JSC189_000469 [Candidatus Tokpelaia sp. JSC189]
MLINAVLAPCFTAIRARPLPDKEKTFIRPEVFEPLLDSVLNLTGFSARNAPFHWAFGIIMIIASLITLN